LQFTLFITKTLLLKGARAKKFFIFYTLLNSTNDFPNHGIADNRFVITVAKFLIYIM